MSNHTPGPCVHHREDNIITTPNGLCKLLEWQARSLHVPQEERDANARRIAAALDLLTALKMLHDETADYIRLNNLGGMDNQCMQLARAALAKAVGAA